jgi:hypothetical protein
MSIIFIFLLIPVALVVLVLLIALFTPKTYHIQRSTTIDQPVAKVYSYIRYIKNQEQYSKWVMTDPNMQKTFTGTDGTVGFIYAWDSTHKNAGKGEQEITGLIEDKSVNIEIRFEKPFAGIGYAEQRLDANTPAQTTITWSMRGTSVYPMNITNLFIDKILGSDLEKSLTTLKRILEIHS